MPEMPSQHRDGVRIATMIVMAVLVSAAIAWFFADTGSIDRIAQLRSVSGVLGQLILIGALAGVAGMAIMQFRKNLVPLRGRYHVDFLRTHFDASWPDLVSLVSVRAPDLESEKARRQSVPLTPNDLKPSSLGRFKSGEDLDLDDFVDEKAYARYLDELIKIPRADSETSRRARGARKTSDEAGLARRWDVPSGQVIAQLAQIGEYLLARPRGHVALLRRFVGANGSATIDRYMRSLVSPPLQASETSSRDDPTVDLRHYVEQNLDSLLLAMSAEWRAKVRIEAAITAALVGVSALLHVPIGAFAKVSAIAASGVFGAFFAWFARDVVAGVEKWRS